MGKITMSDKSYIAKPCQHCPFRNDVPPFLRAERGEELALSSLNPYNSFPCHKTTVHSDDEDDFGEMLVTKDSKQCAGFLTLRAAELGENNTIECQEGFKPSYDIVYEGVDEMIDNYIDNGF